jgi:hypothetical protein
VAHDDSIPVVEIRLQESALEYHNKQDTGHNLLFLPALILTNLLSVLQTIGWNSKIALGAEKIIAI